MFEPDAPEIEALSRVHRLAEELIVRLARGKIEKPELIESLGKIANDAEDTLKRLGVVPF